MRKMRHWLSATVSLSARKIASSGWKSCWLTSSARSMARSPRRAMAVVHAEDEAIGPPKATGASKPCVGRGVLPKHLPRIEELIAPDDVTCGCGSERHIIGEDVSERLDIVPAQFRVIVTRRPKYACRSCEAGILQAPAKPRLIEGGMPTEATAACVIVSKYADHLPLYRQSQIYAWQGVDIDQSTLAFRVGKAP